MHSTDGLRWYLALGHGTAAGAWWGWVALCALAGSGALVWWWHRGRVRQRSDRLGDFLPPIGLMLLGALMLFVPLWSGLDVWLNDVDDTLLWAFMSDAPSPTSGPIPQVSMLRNGDCVTPCDDADVNGRCVAGGTR